MFGNTNFNLSINQIALRVFGLTVMGLLFAFLFAPRTTYAYQISESTVATGAQSTIEQSGDSSSTWEFVPPEYDYTVKPGNNMTLLIRRSLQLYDQARPDIELSHAQIVYAETNIAKEIKARDLILPGEKVKLDSSLIAKYALASQKLTEAELAAWQKYANLARFDLEDIQPDNITFTDKGEIVSSTNNQPQDATDKAVEDLGGVSSDQNTSNSWYWWLIALGSVALLSYLTWRRQETS